jgi:predicted Zn-dependent protease
MMNNGSNRSYRAAALLLAAAFLLSPLAATAQTHIVPPKNKYSIEDDIKLGRQAEQEVYRQMQVLRDPSVEEYVNSVGQRLARAIPPEYQHPEFRYTFQVINARDINAFSLPGGPMFLNSGMIEAADNEGEMAGVMAHEMSHVALRHVTAQATATEKYQIGSAIGQIAGAILGGVGGAVLGAGSQIGGGLVLTKFSRGYEKQADLLGAQIMARAGYDPRDLAKMFQKIEAQGRPGGPEWLSDHPNPGNRYQYIMQEAAMLRVAPGEGDDSAAFHDIQARLRGYPGGRSGQQTARSNQRYPNQGNYPNRTDQRGYGRSEQVAYPSSNYVTQRTNLFSVSIPSNWQSLGGDRDTFSYAPQGAYGSQGITHGVMFSVAQSDYNDLQRATDEVVQGLLQANDYLSQTTNFQRTTIDGRDALAATLTGRSPITGKDERVTVITTMLSNGQVFYMAAVTPQSDYATYQQTFNRILQSLRLNSRY